MVRRQSAAGYDTVNVRMALHSLPPRMQNTEESDLGPEVPGIGRNFQQRGGAGFEQETEEDLLVLPHQRVGGGLRGRHFGGPRGAGPQTDDGGQWRTLWNWFQSDTGARL